MQKIKGIIFDLDGTIANTLPLCIQAFRKSVEPLINRSITDEEIIATFGPSEEGSIMALAPDHYEKGLKDYLYYYKELHGICPVLFDGIGPMLQTLQQKNIPLAMVTGKGVHSSAISLSQFNATHFFSIIETGWVHGPRKAAGIEAVLNNWSHINKDAIIYVGDAPSDIEACRKTGIRIAAAAWASTAEPEKLRAMQPDELFYSVDEFAQWLYRHLYVK